MKTVIIEKREILERTDFRKYRFKEVTHYVLTYDNNEYTNVSFNRKTIKKPLNVILKTRCKKELQLFIEKLGRSDADKWLKEKLFTEVQ